MLKLFPTRLTAIEAEYPGFLDMLADFESLDLPSGEHCGSADTAAVQAGLVGRTFRLMQATTKIRLTAGGSDGGSLWCHACRRHFGPPGRCDLERYPRGTD